MIGGYDKRSRAVRLRGLKRDELLQLLADGKQQTEIAEDLRVCRVALGKRIRNICENLGARSKAHAVAIAIRKGIIQ